MIKQFFLTILLAQFSIALFSSTAFAQAVFNFDELQLPGEGFFNGDPTQQAIDAIINVTSETLNPFQGVPLQVDQTTVTPHFQVQARTVPATISLHREPRRLPRLAQSLVSISRRRLSPQLRF